MTIHSYFAYGLGIQSEIPLPELSPVECDPAVTIRRGDTRAARRELGPQVRDELEQVRDDSGWVTLTPGEAVLSLPEFGRIVVRNGQEIVVDMPPSIDAGLVRQLLLGTVMGVALGQRGKLVLHASCVECRGRAVAIVGASGWGKSSLAAALVARGFRLVADDVTAVEIGAHAAAVYVGVPQIKLAPVVAAALGFESARLTTLWEGEKKKALGVPLRAAARPIPLSKIFVLDGGDSVAITPFRPSEAIFQLIAHSYPTRLPDVADAQRMERCKQVAQRVPVLRAVRTADLTTLPELAAQVESAAQNVFSFKDAQDETSRNVVEFV